MRPETTVHALQHRADRTTHFPSQPVVLIACVVFDRLQTENECTFGNKGVNLDAVKLHRSLHSILSEYEMLFSSSLSFQTQ